MNYRIQTMRDQVANLDSYTQLAVFGAWNFIVNSSCINQAMRYVPDAPVDNGIEEFTEYDAARRALIADADNSQLPPMITMHRNITQWIDEADGRISNLYDTLDFLSGRAPARSQFEAEYERRRRMGMKPGMSKKTFVDYEFERAIGQFNKLVTRGQDAVRLCETIALSTDAKDVPQWLADSFEQKLITKLHSRWERLELSRTNPKQRKENRDAAAADQKLIELVLAEYGETPGFDEEEPVEAPTAVVAVKADAFADDDLSHLPFGKNAVRVPKAVTVQ